MKRMKRILQAAGVFIVFAVMIFATMFMVIGAVRCVWCFVTETMPTFMEYGSLAAVMAVCGVIGAILFITDTEE